MSRFVIVSFALMGWGFYELSGGRDFTPPEHPVAKDEIAATQAPTTPGDRFKYDTSQNGANQNGAKIQAASLVTTPVLKPAAPLNLTAKGQVEATARPLANRARRQAIALDKIASAGSNLHSTASAFAPTAETGLLHMDNIQGGLASMTTRSPLADGTNALALTAGLGGGSPALHEATPESHLDIREIRASRVNMRQGPGTIYPVSARLLAGDKVLILDDSGTGWLQLRTKAGNKIGWVAASLVSKKGS